jgi:hypothetical protein
MIFSGAAERCNHGVRVPVSDWVFGLPAIRIHRQTVHGP